MSSKTRIRERTRKGRLFAVLALCGLAMLTLGIFVRERMQITSGQRHVKEMRFLRLWVVSASGLGRTIASRQDSFLTFTNATIALKSLPFGPTFENGLWGYFPCAPRKISWIETRRSDEPPDCYPLLWIDEGGSNVVVYWSGRWEVNEGKYVLPPHVDPQLIRYREKVTDMKRTPRAPRRDSTSKVLSHADNKLEVKFPPTERSSEAI